MESSIDNDRFLHSLESAIFTASDESPTVSGGRFNASPFYSSTSPSSTYSSNLQEGDLGKALITMGGRLYPPLPPGSPVVGFAYLGLQDCIPEEEAEETQSTDTVKGAKEAASGGFH